MRTKWRTGSQFGLFGKVFVVMVISTIAVAVMTSWVIVHVSQQLFMNTFSITNSKVIQQVKRGFESYNYSIVTVSNAVLQSATIRSFLTQGDGDSLANIQAYYRMSQQLKSIQSGLDINEVGTAILGINGRSFFSKRSYWVGPASELKEHPLTRETLSQPGKLSYHYLRDDTATSGIPLIVASKVLMVPTTKEIYGTLYMMMKESDFKQFYANFTSTGNDVLILDHNGLILSGNQTDLIGHTSRPLLEAAAKIRDQNLRYSTLKSEGHSKIVVADYLPAYDCYIVNLIDKKQALSQLLPIKQILLIGAAIVAASLLILFIITRRLTKSLRMMVRQMSSVTKRHFHNYIPVTGSYETRELGRAFNYMLDELNDYIDQLVKTQREQRNAELTALQRQINPHFLYNTLASVNILVQRGDKEKATETIHALISLIQHTISNTAETFTVEEELINLKHYVFINQVRYGTGIQVDYFVAPETLKARLPKLLLQPFIENAFFHAFKERNAGLIYVMIAKEGNTLLCEIVDDGEGMKIEEKTLKLPGPKNKSQLFTGIGIRNVNERIMLLYGEPYGVSIDSSLGKGTKVSIRIPWQEREPEEA